MKGLQLSRAFYEQCALPLLRSSSGLLDVVAVGQVGEGSECFGFDDEYSRDHDFGPTLCFWLPESMISQYADAVQDVIELLPEEFEGLRTRVRGEGGRTGLHSVEGFYQRFLGISRAPQDWKEWMRLPQTFLAVCTNGEVFSDSLGTFSAMRKALLDYYPEDVRLKRLAARCMNMAQSGQYNLPRSLQRGEKVAALIAASRFVEESMAAVYLLNRKYCPFYKWAHHGVRPLPVLGEFMWEKLPGLIATLSSSPDEAKEIVEEICVVFADVLREQGLSDVKDNFLLAHGPAVQSHIQTPGLRDLPTQTG